ncbi:hypothetical protein BJ912DRAFT_991180 [Pholiota molesta]|nr:hypothetical protein BJ912DRAFT_991180 [Pholiota molesta]
MDPNSSGAPRMPKAFYSTYRQYKENERKILFWVHRTVADIRDQATKATAPTSTASRGRAQKSRARKGGPKKTHATVDPDFASPKFSFSLFIRLVEEIAESDIVIPVSQLTLLQLSIKQRKRIAAYYSSDMDVSESNKSHLHAIRAYMKAFEILKDAEEKRSRKDVNGHLRQSPDVEDNIFALSEAIQQLSVTLEEEGIDVSAPVGSADNEWIRDNAMINSPGKPGEKQKKPSTFPLEEYELVMDDYVECKSKKAAPTQADAFDALECFLLDVYAMRRYCNEIWKSVVPAGNTSHIAASFVTNKAVQLVKEMEYALLADFPALKDMKRCYDYLGQIVEAGWLSHGRDQKMVDSWLDQIMVFTWKSVTQFGELLNENPTPLLRDGHFGYFDPSADREKMSSDEQFFEDRCIMCNHWPDLIFANIAHRRATHEAGGEATYKILGSQGLLQDFTEFYNSKPRHVSWALIFACQIQADSVLARRKYLHYDLSVMRNLGRMISQEYQDFMNDGVLYSENMDMSAKPFISQSAVEVQNWMELDLITQLKLRSDFDKVSKQATQKDAFWLQNSWLTANVIAEASLDFFFAGVAVMAAGGFIQSTIQLWNMLRQTGYLPQRTSSAVIAKDSFTPKDHVLLFDHLMDIFGDKVFSGPPPKSNFLISWEIMMGTRPEAFARGRRQLKKGSEFNRPHNEHGRGVEPEISELFNMHHAKYFTKNKGSTASRNQTTDKNGQKHPLAATLDLVNSELGQSATLQSQAPFEPRGPLININLFKVHRLCFSLFTELERVLRPEIERFIGSPLDHTQINWPYLTGWIAMTERTRQNGGKPDRVMLQKAADVVQKFVGEQELGPFLIREEGDESLIL